MKLSIIIPCYNAEKTIAAQLEALAGQQWDHPWEIVVADNGSSDNTIEISKEFRGRISNLSIHNAGEKKGASYARNLGVKNSGGEYIAFVDADDVVAENWLNSIGNALLKHDFVACRMEWSKLNDFSDYVLKAKVQTDGLINFGLVKFLPFAGSGTLGIKKCIHAKVGGFDETLKYNEDTDYSWKVQLAGHKLIFIPEAVIHIRARNTNNEVFKQHLNWAQYDVYLYEKYKHHGMPVYTVKQSVRSLYHILRSWRDFFSPEKKGRWIIRFAQQLGRLKGMIKAKYFKYEKGLNGVRKR